MKTPAGSGLNAAFFSYIGPEQSKPHDEIDFEVLLRDTASVDTTTFVNGVSGDGEVGAGQSHALPHPSNHDFITYAFTWEPDKVLFYIDGTLVRTIDDTAMVPKNPQRIFFSLWGGHVVLAQGLDTGLHRIERLMRQEGLRARPRRRGLHKDGGQRHAVSPTFRTGRSSHRRRSRSGSPTSPTSGRPGAGSMWRRSSTFTPDG